MCAFEATYVDLATDQAVAIVCERVSGRINNSLLLGNELIGMSIHVLQST
jgi:hypothetical protein